MEEGKEIADREIANRGIADCKIANLVSADW
jgi:hypothetical protein